MNSALRLFLAIKNTQLPTFYGSFLFVYVCDGVGQRHTHSVAFIYNPALWPTNSECLFILLIFLFLVSYICFSSTSSLSTVPPEENMLKLCRECTTAIRLILSLFLPSPVLPLSPAPLLCAGAVCLDTSAPLGELDFSYSAVQC